ncbi:hypothetical protein [Sulfurivirga sp.]|uniref:hypothetical protein n=1 Tax=Sulfurivirga sp. TaxID=2614236 RepID=UPI0025D6BB0A|nr:hypothetical protein [Sulfurivirga sp.]
MDIDLIMHFSSKRIEDRDLDTFIGLAKGLIADGVVNQTEAQFLKSWILHHNGRNHPLMGPVYNKIRMFLSDGRLDDDEAKELFELLLSVAGETPDDGELMKSSTVFFDNPVPDVEIEERMFVLTGIFAYGRRRADVEALIRRYGGRVGSSVCNSTDYLVIGAYVSPAWVHESYGRKIERALYMKRASVDGRPFIISERSLLEAMGPEVWEVDYES